MQHSEKLKYNLKKKRKEKNVNLPNASKWQNLEASNSKKRWKVEPQNPTTSESFFYLLGLSNTKSRNCQYLIDTTYWGGKKVVKRNKIFCIMAVKIHESPWQSILLTLSGVFRLHKCPKYIFGCKCCCSCFLFFIKTQKETRIIKLNNNNTYRDSCNTKKLATG